MQGPTEPFSHSDLTPNNGLGSVRTRMGRVLMPMRGDGLRARTLRGASWTTMSFGIQQFLRLGSNLVLTRLLFPEAFGLMALAQVFSQGLKMLSDIGVGPSIVQNERGDDPKFLATAWTMQVIRGFILAACMCLLAYPAALFYDQAILTPILLFMALGSVIHGFQNIGVSTASRKLMLGRITLVDLVSQIVGIAVMIVWAYYSRNVWALVGGGLVAAVVRLAMGYKVFPTSGSWFHFERDAASDIFHFGKWIFLATAMTYFGGQGLRLIQGSFVSMSTLGMISVAGSIALLGRVIVSKVVGSVLFPAFAELHRKDQDKFVRKIRAMRVKVLLGMSPFFILTILFGKPIIAVLYDERYEQAGVYFVILSAATAVHLLRVFFGETMFVKGDSFGHAYVMFFTSVLHILGVVLGYVYGGVVGMLWAGVVVEAIIYPIAILRVRKYGIWSLSVDAPLLIVYIALCAAITIM